MRWENWLEVLRLCSQMFRFRKSRHRLFILSKGKVKKHRKDLWDVFLGTGGRLWKGKVLAPFSSMVIHGLLVTCLDHLLLLFNCLKWCFLYGFKNILKRGLCLGNLCNDSCLNVYKGVCLLKNVSMFESLFWEMFWNCVVCFEISKDGLQVWSSN